MTEIAYTDALLVVDMQNDFCMGGSLAVPDADLVIRPINSMLLAFSHLVFSRDWHPADHCSFSDTPEYRDGSWPSHCVQYSPGAEFPHDLRVPVDALIVDKGTLLDKEAYSIFEDTGLADILRKRGILRVFVAGLALDYCVKATALDAVREGFSVVLVEDATLAVVPEQSDAVLNELHSTGVISVRSDSIS